MAACNPSASTITRRVPPFPALVCGPQFGRICRRPQRTPFPSQFRAEAPANRRKRRRDGASRKPDAPPGGTAGGHRRSAPGAAGAKEGMRGQRQRVVAGTVQVTRSLTFEHLRGGRVVKRYLVLALAFVMAASFAVVSAQSRSEERRVGKACTSWCGREHTTQR